MKKIMILGSAGMLGHMVYHYLNETNNFLIVDTSFPLKANDKSFLLDVTSKLEVESYIRREKPDIVINCVGILIKASQTDPSNAIYLNSYFPHQLSKLLREIGGKLIHISTDCVFTGKKGDYKENDFRDADDTYGRSKALGEVFNDHDLTLRTSIIGPDLNENGEGLFQWFMKQSGEINGFMQTFWGGVTTLELAKAIEAAINLEITGLVHITNGTKISKYDLISLFKEVWKVERITINPIEGKHADKSLICSRSDFQYLVPSYKEMLKSQHKFMLAHLDLYSKNY